ncbi:MAG: hypothetical protein ACI4W6_03525 [Acutalibacteraceae bacterium]
MNRLRTFMAGRYGMDQLNIALIIVGCIITGVLSFLRIPYFRLIGLIPFIIAFARALSRNTAKRKKANDTFIKIWIPWKNFFITKSRQHSDTEHKYYKCPQCSHTLRVPKHRGKIEITCPYCQKKFKKNTGKKIVQP